MDMLSYIDSQWHSTIYHPESSLGSRCITMANQHAYAFWATDSLTLEYKGDWLKPFGYLHGMIYQLLHWGIFTLSIIEMIDFPHSFCGLPYLIEGFSFALLVTILMILSRWAFRRAWPSIFYQPTTYDSLVDHYFEATTISPVNYFS